MQSLENTSVNLEAVLEKLRVPRRRLHLDATGNVVVGEDQFAAKTRTNIAEKLSIGVENQCWAWTGHKDRDGYGITWVKPKTIKAHRLIFNLIRGPIPSGMLVCHKCDNPGCVNPEHLFLGSNSENIQDSISKGRWACGESKCGSKLTDGDVKEIRRLYDSGAQTPKQIAAQFQNVSYRLVWLVCRRKAWRHVA